jgi:hypothetical protein
MDALGASYPELARSFLNIGTTRWGVPDAHVTIAGLRNIDCPILRRFCGCTLNPRFYTAA